MRVTALSRTRLALRLSEQATVAVRFDRCIRAGGGRTSCRTVLRRALRVPGPGRATTRSLRLSPGAYRVAVTATDAAGNSGRISVRPRVR